MPKETFFGIDKEKQNRIIQAAIKVFSSHNYNDSSINEVIKLAKIPREVFINILKIKEIYISILLKKLCKTLEMTFLKN